MFQDSFLLHFLFNILRLPFVSFESMFQDFSSLSHIKNSLHFHSPFSLLLLYIYMCVCVCARARAHACPQLLVSSYFKYTQTKNNVIYFQSFNDTYVASTLQYHFILTRMSRL